MSLSGEDLTAIWLTLQLAAVVTALLLLFGTPLAWWLTHTRSRVKVPINALVALPLVLPPTVLGFYLLLAMGPSGPLGAITDSFGLDTLAFSFSGLVIGSMVYSLPFVIQPLQNAFANIDVRHLEVAATLGASPPRSLPDDRPTPRQTRVPDRLCVGFRAYGGGIRCGVDDWRQYFRRNPSGVRPTLRPCRGSGLPRSSWTGTCVAAV